MFRIRRVYDDLVPINRDAIAQVQKILRSQFSLLSEGEIAKLPDLLVDPVKYRFRSVLYVADDQHGRVKGFALLLHDPALRFCYLDFLSAAPRRTGGGIGGILYERIRAEALGLGARDLFFECLPDDPALCGNPEVLKQNAARLRFYERYGARPIANTEYETPVKPGDDCAPYLVYDDLGTGAALRRGRARAVVRAILERKYGAVCPPAYIERVVRSFRDSPIRIREPRYLKKTQPVQVVQMPSTDRRVMLVVNEAHALHHVEERGYVEAPVRIRTILKAIEPTGFFVRAPARRSPDRRITAVHDPGFVNYLKKVTARIGSEKSLYPYVFPIRNSARPPKELAVRAGYYCIDTFTPLNRSAYIAARAAVDCALTAAEGILEGFRVAYALVRPPGHHAERRVFGGFCYFNSAAVAAHYLSGYGKVAVLDIDYHHGNGTQDIFYRRRDVLTVSIHGHPSFTYPYFSGFSDERGIGEGEGYNVNYPCPEEMDGAGYREVLARALERVKRYEPQFLVLSLGLDVAKGDPTGSWILTSADLEANGDMIAQLRLPTVVIQEGGYRTRSLGVNARHFFVGMMRGYGFADAVPARRWKRAVAGDRSKAEGG